MRVPQPIPYQGSKRNLARYILGFFPDQFDTLIEPFAGSAAISVAAATTGKASKFWLNDVNRPLMRLWDTIINDPEHISRSYAKLWREQQGREKSIISLSERNSTRQANRSTCCTFWLAA